MTTKELPILIIDGNRSTSTTLAEELRSIGYQTESVNTLDELDHIIDSGKRFLLAVMDISEFHNDIWDRCGRIRAMKTPCIAITPHRSASAVRETISHGVDALLVAPVTIKEIIEHIRTTLGEA